MKLQGIYIDTTTPFNHAGDLYRVKVEHNIGKWNRTSVAGYVVGGYTGEGVLLSPEEKAELWRIAAASAAPEKTLIAGIGCAGVRGAVDQVNGAAETGFAAALVESPSGAVPRNRPFEAIETQLLYFRSIADRARIPILIESRPDLAAGTALALSSHPNICGIVDHSGDPAGIERLGSFPVLWGDARSLWRALQNGAAGAVLALANAAPYATIALWEAYRTREQEAGLDWQARIAEPSVLLDRQYTPGLKHAMDLNGYYGGPPRLPLAAPGPAEKAAIERVFTNLRS